MHKAVLMSAAVALAVAVQAGALEMTDTAGKDIDGVLSIGDGDSVLFQYRYTGVPFKPCAGIKDRTRISLTFTMKHWTKFKPI